MFTSSRKSTRESHPDFPLFLGYDLNHSHWESTGMVEVSLWAFWNVWVLLLENESTYKPSIPGFSGFTEREIYCNDKVTRSGVFRTKNRSDNWKVYMESYGYNWIYIEKHSSQRNLLQVVVVWRDYTPSETDGYRLLWKTSQKAIGLPISFWVATVAGQNLATVAVVVELPSIAVL